jgi:hypothetical protein
MTSKQVFERFVPAAAVDYCSRMYETLGFEFKITRSRNTKLGDFRYLGTSDKAIITVNNDLNPYAFVVTYLHEVAHLLTYREFKGSVSPHGQEWKSVFTKITEPLLTEEVFPPNVLVALKKYFKNPKASSCADPNLYKALALFNSESAHPILDEIALKTTFQFNKRLFMKLEKRRTRWVCLEIKSNRKYLIPGIVEVKIVADQPQN